MAPDVHRSIVVITLIAAEMVSSDRAPHGIGKSALSTNKTALAGSEVIDQWIAQGRVPVPRWGTPQHVGAVVATLASGRMPYTTGQPFWVAGGPQIPRAT